MVAPTQCVISAGRAVQLQWTELENGSIKLLISIPPAGSPGGVQRVGSCDNSSWTYSEQSRDDSSTIAFQDSSRDDSNNTTEDLNQEIKALRGRIAPKSGKTVKTLQQNIERWLNNPDAFFGISGFRSLEQFSFQSLENSKQELHRYHMGWS